MDKAVSGWRDMQDQTLLYGLLQALIHADRRRQTLRGAGTEDEAEDERGNEVQINIEDIVNWMGNGMPGVNFFWQWMK